MSFTLASWMRYLSAQLGARIEHRFDLQNILVDVDWLFGDKVLRMRVGLLVWGWIACYLGPAQFELVNYVITIVALSERAY
jgi:hypothetical protein